MQEDVYGPAAAEEFGRAFVEKVEKYWLTMPTYPRIN